MPSLVKTSFPTPDVHPLSTLYVRQMTETGAIYISKLIKGRRNYVDAVAYRASNAIRCRPLGFAFAATPKVHAPPPRRAVNLGLSPGFQVISTVATVRQRFILERDYSGYGRERSDLGRNSVAIQTPNVAIRALKPAVRSRA